MRTILALTAVTALAVTVIAFMAGGALVGSTETAASTQTRSGGLGANPQGSGFLRGHDRLAKSDMTGSGGGGKMGGMMGDMMGSMGKGKGK
jgi:hypothetical protein